VLLVTTVLLALAGLVLLLVGYARDSLTLLYLSIGCTAAAGVALIVLSRVRLRRDRQLAGEVAGPATPAAPAEPPVTGPQAAEGSQPAPGAGAQAAEGVQPPEVTGGPPPGPGPTDRPDQTTPTDQPSP
jgi:hypothetical protein